jgi:hypothetical protein
MTLFFIWSTVLYKKGCIKNMAQMLLGSKYMAVTGQTFTVLEDDNKASNWSFYSTVLDEKTPKET